MCRPFTGQAFDCDVYDCPCGHGYGLHGYHYDKQGIMVVHVCSACSGTLATLEIAECPCGHGHDAHYYKWFQPFFVDEGPNPRCSECLCEYDLHAANTKLGYAVFELGCGLCAAAKEVRREAVPIVVRRKKG